MSLRLRILAVLRRSAVPVPTPDLIAVCAADMPHARSQVWVVLSRLVRRGKVRAVRRKHEATRWAIA